MSARIIAPVVLGVLMLGLWEAAVRAAGIPPYILPGPILVAKTLVADWGTLAPSLLVTVEITLEALAGRGRGRRPAGGAVLAVALDRALALSLRHHPAGDADRGDRAADHRVGQRRRRCRC